MKTVAVILVNYKTVECAIECIDSLKKQTYSEISIIVVDNASEDDCEKILHNKWPDLCIIQNNENIGFSGANNIGIKHALENKASYIMLLNCDTLVPENYVESLVEVAKNNQSIGIVSGKILYYYDPSIIWSAGGYLNKIKGSADIIGFLEKNKKAKNDLTECTFVSGCCMLIPVTVLEKVGFLSENYFLYFEDTDYCSKYIRAGYKIVTDNRVEMLHKESVSTNKKSELYTYYFTRNRLLYIRDNEVFPLKYVAYLYSLAWFLKKILFKEFIFKAVVWGIADFVFGKTGKSTRNFN